ncbi:MAG: acetyl-CoA carboxylase carboxyltransferase subunit alpha [Lachnospiraceae bacterium]|jgi:acetyl-CoA carboxylase carboxyl transferase subunit alpha|nr:acetyl-CoA carboxylase carboxyltransferase subunit alpha [Lachnospiraceae bacterium]
MGDFDRVLAARDTERPTGLQFFSAIFSEFMELHGDRCFGDDPAIVGGIGRLNGMVVTAICTEKGRSTREKVRRNFGSAHPEGYRKALRLMKQAEKFGRPVICFVDTAGAFCGLEAEERGQGQAIAENLMEMMTLTVPVITVITGEGGSGGALGLAVANEVWMLENAAYSVISPEGCASILWKDAARREDAAEHLGLTAEKLRQLGIVDRVIQEDAAFEVLMKRLGGDLYEALVSLQKLSREELTESRYQRFRRIGTDKIRISSEAEEEK